MLVDPKLPALGLEDGPFAKVIHDSTSTGRNPVKAEVMHRVWSDGVELLVARLFLWKRCKPMKSKPSNCITRSYRPK